MKLVVLLPPSEGKASGGSENPLSELHPVTQELLGRLIGQDPQKIYSSRHNEAAQLNAQVRTAPTMPAIKRYTGVVYDALDYDTLEHKEWIDEHVLIVSGLFGLLTPQQRIPNYKFPITLLSAAKLWKPHQHLTECFVVDLLPKTHKKAVTYDSGVEIDFTRTKNGKIVSAGHHGKHIKGRFVRWLAEHNVTTQEEIYQFTEDGYRWTGASFHKD